MKKADCIIKTTKSLFRCLLPTDVQRYNLYVESEARDEIAFFLCSEYNTNFANLALNNN